MLAVTLEGKLLLVISCVFSMIQALHVNEKLSAYQWLSRGVTKGYINVQTL